jgi:hypothetical protein
MTNTLLDETAAGEERREAERPEAVIRGQVLRALGRPAGLFRVEVRRLWENHYRVNVFVGPDAAAVTIPHSYFVVADAAGNVTASTPAIRRVR